MTVSEVYGFNTMYKTFLVTDFSQCLEDRILKCYHICQLNRRNTDYRHTNNYAI